MGYSVLEFSNSYSLSLGAFSIDRLYTGSSPNVILSEFYSSEQSVNIKEFLCLSTRSSTFWDKAGLKHTDLGPVEISHLNSSGSPQTILVEFYSASVDVILFGGFGDFVQASPDIPPFAGDMGFYIG